MPLFIQPALDVIRNNLWSSSSNNHKLLAKFHSGTLRITNAVRLMSPFLNYRSNTYWNLPEVVDNGPG